MPHGPIRFWDGFDGSWRASSMGQKRVDTLVDHELTRQSSNSLSAWPKTIPSWGYDRIVGALANLGHEVSDQTVGNVLKRHGVLPAPERKKTTTWAQFIRSHLAVLAGTDFFSVEVLTHRGLVTFYVLFFIHLASRKVEVAGITVHPNEQWMQQIARNVTMEGVGLPGQLSVSAARPGREVHRVVSRDHQGGRSRARRATAAKSESECLFGALGEIGERGMLVQADSVR